jgi:hypothetical protein
MVIDIVGCGKVTPFVVDAQAETIIPILDSGISLGVSVTPDKDSDGIPNSEPEMILPRPVTELTAARVKIVIREQGASIKRQKKVVDGVDGDINTIQQVMQKKRDMDLEALAKRRKWDTKVDPKNTGSMYKEWKQVRVREMSPPASHL